MSRPEPPAAGAVPSRLLPIDRVGSRELEERIRAAQQRGVDVLMLEGSPKLIMPEHVQEAAAACHRPLPQPSEGAEVLREAIHEAWAGEFGAPPISLLVTNGAMHALNLLFRAVLRPGDNVVIPAPNFFFSGAIALAGGEARFVQSEMDSGWAWDVDALEQACDDATRAIVFSNPVNPTGYLPAEETLEALLQLARSKQILVVSDESYSRYVYDGRFVSLAAVPEFTDVGVVIRSFSKDYALAPWRVGYMAAPGWLMPALVTILEWELLYVSDIAQRVAAAAVRGPQTWLADVPHEYRERRDRVLAAVRANPRLACTQPPAAPFLFVDTRGLGDADPVETLLAVGIPTVSGRYFGTHDRYVRIPFGGSAETLSALCSRLSTV